MGVHDKMLFDFSWMYMFGTVFCLNHKCNGIACEWKLDQSLAICCVRVVQQVYLALSFGNWCRAPRDKIQRNVGRWWPALGPSTETANDLWVFHLCLVPLPFAILLLRGKPNVKENVKNSPLCTCSCLLGTHSLWCSYGIQRSAWYRLQTRSAKLKNITLDFVLFRLLHSTEINSSWDNKVVLTPLPSAGFAHMVWVIPNMAPNFSYLPSHVWK